jgi:diguanylate cyclase (GGDEF)-like protein
MAIDAAPARDLAGHPGWLPMVRKPDSCLEWRTRRLAQILWATLTTVSAFTVTFSVAGDWRTVFVTLTTISLLLLAVSLVHGGRVDQAATLMLTTLTMAVSCGMFLNQGIRGEGLSAFPVILVLASMFGTRRFFFTIFAAISAVLAVIVIANVQGWHVNAVRPVTMGSLVNVLSVMSMTAFVVYLTAGDLRNALRRLEAENERLRESHARIDLLAHHDSLTGLPNRVLARDRLGKAVAMARRKKESVALILLDLDDFKTVNESLGHATGDLLLCDVAKRLTHGMCDSDTVSRQGGDEFLIIMEGLADEQAVATMAAKVIDLLSAPFHVDGLELSVTCSLGIALFPTNGSDFDTLFKNADVAMYRAKESGRSAFRFYDPQMNRGVIETLHLISGIRSALAKGEFELHYQPQYELKSGRIVGAEALIRWRHPDLGLILPARFIPVAERSGLIHKIGAWVLNEACRQAKQWQEAGLVQLTVAVNLSPIQFRRDDIERDVINALAASDLSPSCLELELSESLLIAESKHLSPLLGRLRAMGVGLSIDDFGTGYSNLGYLQRFHVERLKIDQSFVRRLSEDRNDKGIVRAIIEMAHNLNLEVVAEGIEDLPTMTRLIELGCKYGQGFHWSAALPPEQFFEFVARNRGV